MDLLPQISNILFVQNLSYFIIFILMCLEGPIITFAAAFAASGGYVNVWIIFILAVFGNFIPDMLFFLLGRTLKIKTIGKIDSYFAISRKKISSLERNIKNHSIKTIAIVKLVPLLAIPGLILIGFMKVPPKKFIIADFILNMVFAILFVSLGYYSGITISAFATYVKRSEIVIPIALIIIGAIYYILRRLSVKLEKEV